MTSTMTEKDVPSWFVGRLPDSWFISPPSVRVDRDEVLVIGELSDPQLDGADASDEERERELDVARRARIDGFRSQTRDQRMAIARDAEALWGRKVSWGARCGGVEQRFTTASVPVMTRLRIDERRVLDTLIDAGVARSRSESLAWCVRLVAHHQESWIEQLRDAVATVHEARASGPDVG